MNGKQKPWQPRSSAMKLLYNNLKCDKCKTKVRETDELMTRCDRLQAEIRDHIEKRHKDDN